MIRWIDTFISCLRRHPYIVALCCCVCVCLLSNQCSAAPSDDYVRYCGKDAIEKKYNDAGCWSCDVIFTLMMSMTHIAGVIFNATSKLAMVILGLGSAIWLAVFFLKALGSMATQDTAKLVDSVLLFAFKASFVYVMINSGIDMIVYYIVQPLLQIGIDIGTVYASGTGIGGW